jgi:hypothetical protein
MLISVDIGWKNFAYVCMEDKLIVEWKVVSVLDDRVNVNKTSLEQLVHECTPLLRPILDSWKHAKLVLLESQPMGIAAARNLKTKVLSHIIQSHLVEMGIPVVFRSPRLKLRDMPEQGSYAQNKKYAVQETLRIIAGTSWEPFFKSNSKKDDLADCFLQAYVYSDTVNLN